MLHLIFKVKEVIESPNSEHVKLYATIESASSKEAQVIPIVEDEETKFAKQLGGQLQQTMVQIGAIPMQMKLPPVEAALSCWIHKREFIKMGRPTAGDYIQVDMMKTEATEEHEDHLSKPEFAEKLRTLEPQEMSSEDLTKTYNNYYESGLSFEKWLEVMSGQPQKKS